MAEDRIKLIATNRKAHYLYFLSDYFEAGISLFGTEIKSLRSSHCSIDGAYVAIKNNEAYVYDMDIPVYTHGNIFNHEPKRVRKLLLHKREIAKLAQKVQLKGYTIVVTRCYLKNGKAKLEIALGKGKNTIDKRETIKKRDVQRKIEKELKDHN